jgi:chromosome segregation ATPase
MAKAKDEAVSYQDAWRGFHNVVSQFGPHIEAITAALERAATVEKFLQETESTVEKRNADIDALSKAIAARHAQLSNANDAISDTVRDGEAQKRSLQQEIKELTAVRTRTANELAVFKQKTAADMDELSKRRSSLNEAVVQLEHELESRRTALANLQSRINTARTALGA